MTSAAHTDSVHEIDILTVAMEKSDGADVVHLVGEVDVSTVERIWRAVDSAGSSGRLVLDLSGVEFMDSTGVNAIVAIARRRSRERLGAVELMNPPPPVIRLFEITGLDRVNGVTLAPMVVGDRS